MRASGRDGQVALLLFPGLKLGPLPSFLTFRMCLIPPMYILLLKLSHVLVCYLDTTQGIVSGIFTY